MKRTALKLAVSFCAVAAVGLFAVSRVSAYPEYLAKYAADPLARPDLKTSCATCHVSKNGGGARNAFGVAFKENGFRITPELRRNFPDRFKSQPIEPRVSFDDANPGQAVIEIGGRKWRIDTQAKTYALIEEPAVPVTDTTAAAPVQTKEEQIEARVYKEADDRIISLPTGRAIPRNAMMVNFSHRFAFNEDRTIAGLFGLDGFSTSSFSLIYGITDRVQVGFARSPAAIGRPIEFFGGFNIADEMRGAPVTATVYGGVEASSNFTRNYITSISGTVAKSFTSRARFSITPTVSFNNRPLLATNPVPKQPGVTTFALGVGGEIRFRPSLSFIFEANQRLVNELGAHRPAFGFGIQKVTRDGKHAFALTFNNSPGWTTAQRSGTRGNLFGTANLDDNFSGLSIGFNVTRRLF